MALFVSPESAGAFCDSHAPVAVRSGIVSGQYPSFHNDSVFPLTLYAGGDAARSDPPSEPPPSSDAWLCIASDTPDEDLTRAACGGSTRATALIWRRYCVQVRSKLLRWIGAHDLDDHVQEVFSRLFEQLPRLRQPSALRSFLIGITLRVACSELRRRRRWRLRLTATGELPEILEHSTSDDGIAREALTRFDAILGKLAPRSRRVFELRYIEKLELVDVATEMGISLATAKRHLGRASSRVFAMAARDPSLVEYVMGSTSPPPPAELQATG
jgi:RNA polymerase sigma-70 factor (ECF subfamily)